MAEALCITTRGEMSTLVLPHALAQYLMISVFQVWATLNCCVVVAHYFDVHFHHTCDV